MSAFSLALSKKTAAFVCASIALYARNSGATLNSYSISIVRRDLERRCYPAVLAGLKGELAVRHLHRSTAAERRRPPSG